MPIQVVCQCGHSFERPDALRDQTTVCRQCGRELLVQGNDSSHAITESAEVADRKPTTPQTPLRRFVSIVRRLFWALFIGFFGVLVGFGIGGELFISLFKKGDPGIGGGLIPLAGGVITGLATAIGTFLWLGRRSP